MFRTDLTIVLLLALTLLPPLITAQYHRIPLHPRSHLSPRQVELNCTLGFQQCSTLATECVPDSYICCTGTGAGAWCPPTFHCVDVNSGSPGCCSDGTFSCGPTGATCCPIGEDCQKDGSSQGFACVPAATGIATATAPIIVIVPTVTTTAMVDTVNNGPLIGGIVGGMDLV